MRVASDLDTEDLVVNSARGDVDVDIDYTARWLSGAPKEVWRVNFDIGGVTSWLIRCGGRSAVT